LNASKRELFQIGKTQEGLSNTSPEDIIMISDVDEIPNLEKIDLRTINQKLIFFEQKMFYYKLNLFYKLIPWYGSKACKKKYFKSPQWLRSIKNKKYPIWRLDIMFSQLKYNNIYYVTDGGWHFTNVREPKDLEKKLSNFLHHVDYEQSGMNLEELKRLIAEKKVMYNHMIDKTSHKWGEGEKLQPISIERMPKYIIENLEKYRPWLDL
jgi:beta-1,4-mannosyl-glycoprotein beta-1,4-N-acetylglucosaminyltransferase